MTMVSELVLTRNQLLEIAPAPGRQRLQGAAAAPLARHRRAAGRRHEDAHAADRHRLAEAAARRARPLGGARQEDRARHAGRRDRARPPGARGHQGSADPHGPQLRRPRHREPARAHAPPASRRRARSASPPTTRAARSRSRSPTTAAGSTPPRSAARRASAGSRARPSSSRMSDAQVAKFIFLPGFSTAKAVTSVSGRGVGMDVVKTNIELIGGAVDIALGARPRHELHDQDPADAGDRRGADRQRRRGSASRSRRSPCSSSCG